MKHYLERALVGLLIASSLVEAALGHMSWASYLLILAAVVDFDDWSHPTKPD